MLIAMRRAVISNPAYRWWTLGSLSLGTFTVALSAGLLLPATPQIMPELQASITDVAWLSIAYALSSFALQPILGKQADLHGRRLFFIGGLLTFTAGAALASISWDMLSMGVFRFVQGIGAAAVFPTAMAFVGEHFSEHERGKAMGIWGMARGIALAVGPLAGGWTSLPTVALFVAFAILASALVLSERRAKDPVVDFKVVASPLFLATSATVFLLFVTHRGAIFLVPFFLTDVQRFSGGEIGLLLLPFFLPMALASPLGGWLADRADVRVPTTMGMALSAVSLGLLALFGADTPYWQMVIVLFGLGLGVALALPPLGKAIIGSAELDRLGATSGMFQLVRSKGGPFGVALVATVFSARAAAWGKEAIADCMSGFGLQPMQVAEWRRLQEMVQRGGDSLTSSQLTVFRELGPRIQEAQDCARLQGQTGGFNEALFVAAGLSFLGVFVSLLIRRRRLPKGVPPSLQHTAPIWTQDAEAMLSRLPPGRRERGRQAVEAYASEIGTPEVTPEVVRLAIQKLRQQR